VKLNGTPSRPLSMTRAIASVLVGVSLAIAMVAIGALAQGNTLNDQPVSGIPTRGVADPPECWMGPGPSCVASVVGYTWSIGPMSSWCTYNSTVEQGWNGTYNSTTVTCSPTVGYINFNSYRNATLTGNISSTGPFEIWLVPSALNCEVVYGLAHIPVPCPPPFGPVPTFSWNASIPSAGTIDLADPALDSGVVPAGEWSLILVDTGSSAETVSATSAVVLAWT
jgi:hypothetical protein